MISDHITVVGHYQPAIEITVLLLTFVALVLRLTSQTLILRKYAAWDDICICISFILAAGLSLTHLVGCDWSHIPGTASAITQQPNGGSSSPVYADETRLWTLEFVQDWLFSVGELFCKVAILHFYKQFCEEKQSRLRTAINMSMSFFVLWSVTLTVALTVFCVTHNKHTKPEDLHRTREAIGVTLMVMQCLTILSDLIVFIIPIPIIWRIKEIFRRKVGIVAFMSLGMLVCMISLLRLRLIYVLFFTKEHIVWYCYGFYLTLSLKLDLAIVCACIPFCKPILQFLYKRFLSRAKPAEEEKKTKALPRPASPYPRPPSSPYPLLSPYPAMGHLRYPNVNGVWQAGHSRNDSEATLVATIVSIPLKSPQPVKTVTVRPTSKESIRSSSSTLDGDGFIEICLKE